AHEVQGGGVGGAAAHDHRHIELVDESLEVQRLPPGGDVLRGDGGAADEEQVHAGVHDRLPVLLRALRRQRTGGGDARIPQLLEPVADQLGLDRFVVDRAHHAHDLVVGGVGDAGELGGGILVAGPQALEVEHAEAAEPTELDRGLGRHQGVHGGGEDREVIVVRVHLPGGGDVIRVTDATDRDHRHTVQSVTTTYRHDARYTFHAHHTCRS